MNTSYHIPVLRNECVDSLGIGKGGVWVDVTFGGGGHSRAILQKMDSEARLFAFDQDADALRNAPDDHRLTLIHSNFRFLRNWMQYYGVEGVDGILADLGVSSHHFDDANRGFSFREDGPLDMRMNKEARLSAAEVVNTYSPERLSAILYTYGELRDHKRIASAIVKARNRQPLTTIAQLMDALRPILHAERNKKDLARIFQALRIEVNAEMDALEQMLTQAVEILRPQGRLVVLTYHSLEDRMVKNIIRSGNIRGEIEQDFYGNRLTPLRAVNNRVITPSPEDQSANPRSRSAKLRIAEKKSSL